MTSTLKTLVVEIAININSESLASPRITPRVSTPNAVKKNAKEFFFTDSAHPSSLSAPIAVTSKNTDFHTDYLSLRGFFINEICVLRNEVILNKQYVDQVLADANIGSQTSKLITKIELLEKEYKELKRIVINKEIIIQNSLLTNI